MSDSESVPSTTAGSDTASEPELLCPTCASKNFVAEPTGMRCQSCRGMLAGGPRARAAIAKSVAQGALDAPQGALSCARCADLLVPVDFEDHRFHACASCRLVWSPKGAAPSLPAERRGKTLRFGEDRVEIRQDGSAVVTSAKEMPDWEPKKRHVPRVHIEDAAYQVTRAIPQAEGRFRYELMPFDATRTMLIGPAIQYDAWYVDARDGVVADLPSPVKTATRALLAVVIAAPLIVGVLYFKPYEGWFKDDPPPASRTAAMKALRPPPPPKPKPKPIRAPTLPPKKDPVVVPVERPVTTRIVSENPERRPPVRIRPKPKPVAKAADLTLSVGPSGVLQTALRIAGRRQTVRVGGSSGNYMPRALAESLAPGSSQRGPFKAKVEFPGGRDEDLLFTVGGNHLILGATFLSKYERVSKGSGVEKWAYKR